MQKLNKWCSQKNCTFYNKIYAVAVVTGCVYLVLYVVGGGGGRDLGSPPFPKSLSTDADLALKNALVCDANHMVQNNGRVLRISLEVKIDQRALLKLANPSTFKNNYLPLFCFVMLFIVLNIA